MKKSRILLLGSVFVILISLVVVKRLENIRQLFAAKDNTKGISQMQKPLEFPLAVPSGYEMGIYADLGGDMPRMLAFDPDGVLFASVTNNGKVIAVVNGSVIEILKGLKQPHGIAFANNKFFLAEVNGVSSYDYNSRTRKATNRKELFKLPSGGGHFTRTVNVHKNKLYVATGSSCNVCEEKDQMRASLWVSDLDGKNLRKFADGLRNTVFFEFDKNGQIWGNDMGRDLLGDKLPPDDLNIIRDGSSYGWPYCYGDKVRDNKFMPGKTVDCAITTAPVYKYPAHIAPLGLTFDADGNVLTAWHGSWNSTVPVGYKVVKLTVKNDQVTGIEDYITGFLTGNKNVLGRPVDLIYDSQQNLYISDDKAGLIYILSKTK